MKTLSCKDLGDSDCNFSAKAATADEVVKMMMDHVTSAHKEKLEEMKKTMSHEQIHAMMLTKVTDES